jgi:hypothetical protein
LLRKPSRMSFHDQPWMMVFALTALHDHDFPKVSGFTRGPPGRPHRSHLTDHRLLDCSSRLRGGVPVVSKLRFRESDA